MPKTKEELNAIKEEVEALNEKCRELTPEELKEVTGGAMPWGASMASMPMTSSISFATSSAPIPAPCF